MKSNFKANTYLFAGALFAGIYYLNKVFQLLPNFVAGFLLGIALVAFGLGLYSINHDIGKLKDRKRNAVKF